MSYGMALLLTLTIECLVLAGWLAVARYAASLDERTPMPEPAVSRTDMFMFVVGMNLITHPIAWMARSYFGLGFWVIECQVVLVEFIALALLPRFSRRNRFQTTFGLALMLNAASLSCGLLAG